VLEKLVKPGEFRILALIEEESPQWNGMERGLGTESRLPILKYAKCFASKKIASLIMSL